MKHFSFLAAALLAVANSAWSDTTWVMDKIDNQTGNVTETQRVLIANDKVRVSADAGSWIVFDAKKNSLTHVMDKHKKYMVMDEASINNLMAMQSKAMDTMKSQMAMMPPAQRAQMEAMMKKMSPQSTDTKPQVKVAPTGKSKDVAGHSCASYEVLLGDKKMSETCLANRKEFKISEADLKTLQSMLKFSKKLSSKFPAGNEVEAATSGFLDRDDLIPVETQPWQGDKPTNTKLVFNSFSFDSIPASQFEVPAGYVQQSMPKMQ